MNIVESWNKLNYLEMKVKDLEKDLAKEQNKSQYFKKAQSQIEELEHKLLIVEKALELACERVKYFEEMQDREMGFSDFFGYDSDYDLQAIIEQYKEQAKEITS